MNPDLQQIGKALLIIGIFIAAAGILLLFGNKIPFIGKLPGDIYIKKDNYTFYMPVATSILVSIIISIIVYFLRK